MSVPISLEEIERRIKVHHSDIVVLDRSTYKNTKLPARFVDSQFGEWWTKPIRVLCGHGHPKRGIKNKTLSCDTVKQRLNKVYNGAVILIEESYISGKKPAKFIDKVFGEFTKRVDQVLSGYRHPNFHSGKYFSQINGSLYSFCQKHKIPYTTFAQYAQLNGIDAAWKYLTSSITIDGQYKKSTFSTEQIFIDLMKPEVNLVKWDRIPLEFKSTYKPDFRLEYNGKIIYVDVHGLWWHCEAKQKDKEYHRKKAQVFKEHGIIFLQFFDDEVKYLGSIVKSIILNKLGFQTKNLYARKLQFCAVSTKNAKIFLITNHLMGYKPANSVGLFNNSDLICLLSYKIKKDHVEIERFATKLNTRCVGGFGKLVSYLKQFNLPIVSFCDLRYADGHSYEALGFKPIGETLGWSWTDGKRRYNRLSCIATKDKSERENAIDRGWFKIYDAGQRKYRLDK